MQLTTIAGAVVLFAGLAVMASALTRWGRSGARPHRVGALGAFGVALVLTAAGVLARRGSGLYAASAAVALVAVLLLAFDRRRSTRTPRLGHRRRR